MTKMNAKMKQNKKNQFCVRKIRGKINEGFFIHF